MLAPQMTNVTTCTHLKEDMGLILILMQAEFITNGTRFTMRPNSPLITQSVRMQPEMAHITRNMLSQLLSHVSHIRPCFIS